MENQRTLLEYKNNSDRFLIQSKDYEGPFFKEQYYLIYANRIRQLEDRVLAAGRAVLGPQTKNAEISALEANKKTFILGVVIKKTKNQATVFEEFDESDFIRENEEEYNEREEPEIQSVLESLCCAEDSLMIEYNGYRIGLIGDIDKDEFATGFVMGLYGHKKEGKFYVEKIIPPELPPQPPLPSLDDSYVLFISGVNMDLEKSEDAFMALSQLIEWVYGFVEDEERQVASKLKRIIFAGDSIQAPTKDLKIAKVGQRKYLEPTPLEMLDRVVEQLAFTVPVDLMSGSNDLCGPMMPQQPTLRRAFDKSRQLGEMFNSVTNPYEFELGGMNFLGTSGQNLNDLVKYTRGMPPLELMKLFLEYSYLVPTSPDTIDGFPFTDRDPHVIERQPHVLFVGNQPVYEQQMVEMPTGASTLLLTIPKFSENREAVLLNMRTRESQLFVFDQIISSNNMEED